MATDPQGEMQFWENGFPFGGVNNGVVTPGEMQFWGDGFPFGYFFTSTTTGIKTINGLAYASVKTYNGMAMSSIKTINGLS